MQKNCIRCLSPWEAFTGVLYLAEGELVRQTNGPVWYPGCFLICEKSINKTEHVQRVEEISASTLY